MGAYLGQTHSQAVHVAERLTKGNPAKVTFRMYSPGSATTSKFSISMSPVLSDVPVDRPVNFGAVRVGGLPGATATATFAVNGPNPILESADTPVTTLNDHEKQDGWLTISSQAMHAVWRYDNFKLLGQHMLSK